MHHQLSVSTWSVYLPEIWDDRGRHVFNILQDVQLPASAMTLSLSVRRWAFQ